MPKANVALLFFIFLFLFIVSPALAANINVTPSGDSYLANGTGAAWYNSGINDFLIVGNLSIPNRAFIMFNLSSVPANAVITGARLYIYQFSYSGVSKYELAYNTSPSNTTGTSFWNEGTLNNANCTTRCNLDQNITWTRQPAAGVLQDNVSVTTSGNKWVNFSVSGATAESYASASKMLSIMLRANDETWPASSKFYAKEWGSSTEYLSVDYSLTDCAASCGACGCSNDSTGCYVPSIVGSYCEIVDRNTTGRIITTTSGCINTFFTCPSGTKCSQLTPQADILSPITEYNIGCASCWFVHTLSGQGTGLSLNCPASKGFSNACIWTNCPNNPECECTGTACNSIEGGVQNITSIPATSLNYTAGCFNPLTGTYDNVVLANGTNSTISDLSQEIFGNTTSLNRSHIYTNTSTTCFDAFGNLVACATPPGGNPPGAGVCTSIGDQSALAIGSLMGISDCKLSETLIAMLVSMAIGFALLFYTRNDGHGGQAFIFGTLISLVMFTVIGWFYSWLMVIIIVIGGYIVAKQLGLGGG